MKKMLLGLSLVGLLAGCTTSGSASGFSRVSQGTSIYTYGVDNSPSELAVIENALGTQGYTDGKNKFYLDVRSLQEQGIPVEAHNNIYSSALVTKAPKGYGVQVSIKTPSNITLVTPYQYQSAVIDLGISDVQVDIASARTATGEGALAGVIFSAKKMGADITPARAEVAQKGLDTMAQVVAENPGVDQAQLANAVNDIKSELLNVNNSDLSNAQITQIVTNNITNNNINITDNSVNNIVNYFEEFNSNEEVLKDATVRESVSEVQEMGIKGYEELQSKFSDFTNYLNSAEGQEQIGNILDKVGNFLQEIGQAVSDLIAGFTR